jgi:hypothetical protein
VTLLVGTHPARELPAAPACSSRSIRAGGLGGPGRRGWCRRGRWSDVRGPDGCTFGSSRSRGVVARVGDSVCISRPAYAGCPLWGSRHIRLSVRSYRHYDNDRGCGFRNIDWIIHGWSSCLCTDVGWIVIVALQCELGVAPRQEQGSSDCKCWEIVSKEL